jgi:DNA-binding SARP family transcriptional activator
LAGALWGDDPPRSSGKVVQNVVLRLRKVLGTGVIETRPGGYVLCAAPDAVDARRFDRLVAEGRARLAGGDPTAVNALSTAMDLWRSAPLPELADWPPARTEVARLEEMQRCVLEDLADASLACGQHSEWVARLETMVSEEPLRERRWGLYMVALYRCGRQADALRTYQRARAELAELGLEPGPELRAIEKAVSTHDPTLAAPRVDGVEPPLPTGVVTFLLTDIEGSATLWERAPQAMPSAIERHNELIEPCVPPAVWFSGHGARATALSAYSRRRVRPSMPHSRPGPRSKPRTGPTGCHCRFAWASTWERHMSATATTSGRPSTARRD